MKATVNTQNLSSLKAYLVMLSLGVAVSLNARENVPGSGASGAGHRLANGNNNSVMASNCSPGITKGEISLNNVRAMLLTDGDMWWDYASSVAKYEIPKGSNSYAMFAGSLWFGGYVNGSDLRVAAMTYRQNGYDFWPGPLNPTDLSIDATTCKAYDKIWQFNRNDVNNFYSYWKQYQTADPATPTWIKDYPGNSIYPGYNVNIPPSTVNGADPSSTTQYNALLAGATSPMNYLAPYYDANGDGTYNYANGDYPAYNVSGANVPRGHCVRYLFGDVTNFWVFNDNGNKHTETGSLRNIGIEIRAQAFEFSTNDELNDMSFYNYEIINWSSNTLTKAYFTVWADCDLGYYNDDYVGCDVSRGLGYQYNGDNYDEDAFGQIGYHDKLPAIGVDFFQGPYADVGDSIDNDRDGCIDCSWSQCANGKFACPPAILDNDPRGFPEQCIMSRFTYYNNTGNSQNGNPSNLLAYYYLMSGFWENAAPMTYGMQGLNAVSASNPPCKFLYPGTTDPLGWGLGYKPAGYQVTSAPNSVTFPPPPQYANWTEYNSGNQVGDRRFMQSAGPFTLVPGAVNYITYGLPFARSNSNNNLEPIPIMEAADDKAQALFDNCFKVLDGPDAPDLTIQELNQQLLITLTNNPYTSNNYEANRYADIDPNIQAPATYAGNPDKIYRFEGYKVYQLKDANVSVTDLYNTDLARLVFQCDIKNGVGQVINYNTDPILGVTPQLMVSGADAGIQNSFSINQDLFASSDKRLINFKSYYFMAVAYAYNNWLPYKQDGVPNIIKDSLDGSGPGPKDSIVVIITDPQTGDLNGQKKPYLQGRRNLKVYGGIPHEPAVEANGTVMNSSFGTGLPVTRIEGQGNGGYALDLTDKSVTDILSSSNGRVQKVTYEGNRAPILVKVTDPLRVVKGDFTLKFVSASSDTSNSGVVSWYYDGNQPVASTSLLDTGKVKNINTIKWYMTGTYTDQSGNKVSKTWLSDEGLRTAQEKIITGVNNESLGFSVTVKQVTDPQPTNKLGIWSSPSYVYGQTNPTDLIESSINSSWLTGIKDVDGSSAQDWILSGVDGASSPNDFYGQFLVGGKTVRIYGDPGSVWERVCGGTWAPFRFVSTNANYPGYVPPSILYGVGSELSSISWADTRLLSSVNVVITPDKSKWTRCPVIDLTPNTGPSAPYIDSVTGTYKKWQLRRALSVDKNGYNIKDANFNSADGSLTADSSMGWFPGYAINVETGERLNVIFGENSSDPANNGNDMLWNPTSKITDATGKVVNGGMHYIYILGHNSDGNFTFGTDVMPSDVRRYDAGQSAYQMLRGIPLSVSATTWPKYNVNGTSSISFAVSNATNTNIKNNKWGLMAELYKDIMWTSMPLSSVDLSKAKGGYSNIPSESVIKIRVPKPFRYGLSGVASPAVTSYTFTSSMNTGSTGTAGSIGQKTYTMTPLSYTTMAGLPADVVTNPQNGNFPMYAFSTNDAVASTYQEGTAKSMLAKINIVPNPYYSHDVYEATRLDLLIKIINLPVKCTIKIYTLSGTLIKTLEKDNSDTYMNWDLRNSANIQIASGLYVFHVNAPGIGTRTLKWFGVIRPFDLQSY